MTEDYKTLSEAERWSPPNGLGSQEGLRVRILYNPKAEDMQEYQIAFQRVFKGLPKLSPGDEFAFGHGDNLQGAVGMFLGKDFIKEGYPLLTEALKKLTLRKLKTRKNPPFPPGFRGH